LKAWLTGVFSVAGFPWRLRFTNGGSILPDFSSRIRACVYVRLTLILIIYNNITPYSRNILTILIKRIEKIFPKIFKNTVAEQGF
jgi:hypothetical protein